MRRLPVFLIVVLWPSMAGGQAVPKVSKEGREAVERLIRACFDDGALKVVKKKDGTLMPVADAVKIEATAARHAHLLTPAMRDAVITNWFTADADQKPVFAACLRAYAAHKKDQRAQAFVALFSATAERERSRPASVRPYQEAIRHFRALGETGWLALCLNDLGLTYHYMADFPSALQHLEEGLAAWRKVHAGPHAGTANNLGNLALAYHDFGEYQRALEHHEQALAMRRQISDKPRPDIARDLYNIGAVYHSLGDYARALEFHQRALAMLRQVFDKPHPQTALALDNVGSAYDALGDTARGLDHLRQALALRQQIHGTPHPEVAQSLHNVGTAYDSQGDHVRALDYLQKALAMRRQLDDRAHIALTLNNLGSVSSKRQDHARAQEYHQEALDAWRRLHKGAHPQAAVGLYNIAASLRRAGDLRNAGEKLDEALKELQPAPRTGQIVLEQLQPLDLRPLEITVSVLHSRGQVLESILPKKPAPAELRACQRCYDLAADVLDRVRREAVIHETSRLHVGAGAAALTARRVGVCRRLYDLTGDAEHLRAALHAAEQGRARVFLDALAQARAGLLGGVDPELRARETRLLLELRAYELRIERAESEPGVAGVPADKLWEERRKIEADLQRLGAEMVERHPQYAALKYPRPSSDEDARRCLAANEVALFYILEDDGSHVLVLEGKPGAGDPARGLAVYPLPGRAENIAELAAALVDSTTLEHNARARGLGAELYALLLGPLPQRLRGKDLVIVPDGPLSYLPFELLVDDGKFLIENQRIRYAPSLTALHLINLWKQKRALPETALFAVGDPIYEGAQQPPTNEMLRGLAWREGKGDGLKRLLHSGHEVTEIAKLLGAKPEFVLTRADATEAKVKDASVKEKMAKARYIHFATHGILGVDKGKQPALVLSLTGNDAEDGFLQMDEVTSLKLNADLVVLSACRTGQGRLHNGEGVRGLARAFLYAGSKGVVCSLWAVDDRETANLMVSMYGRLRDGQTTAEALRHAKLEMIRAGKGPVYWAPFVLIGE